jgi:hypothetical protein
MCPSQYGMTAPPPPILKIIGVEHIASERQLLDPFEVDAEYFQGV